MLESKFHTCTSSCELECSFAGAHKQCKRALSIREKQLGSFDLSVAQSCNVMAIILRQLGKYEEAKTVAERSLNIRQSKYGKRPHPEIAASLNGLAEIEKELGQYVHCPRAFDAVWIQGCLLLRRIVVLDCRSEHRSSQRSTCPLVCHCRHLHPSSLRQKTWKKLNHTSTKASISGFSRRCLTEFNQQMLREKHFGVESFQSMQGFDLLATILCKRGLLEEAEEKAHISVDAKIKTLGNNHPEVARSLIGNSTSRHHTKLSL